MLGLVLLPSGQRHAGAIKLILHFIDEVIQSDFNFTRSVMFHISFGPPYLISLTLK